MFRKFIYSITTLINIFFVSFFFNSCQVKAQIDPGECNLFCYEDSLNFYFNQIANVKNDQLRNTHNNKIISIFQILLKRETSFNHPFNSLKQIAKIHSPDSVFRIYSWTLLFNDNTYKHFGFIQYILPSENKLFVYQLLDKSDTINNPENQILNDLNWFGAVYYKIIIQKLYNNNIYTLLGFNANNIFSNKKIIEVLTFEDQGKPVFGKPIFKSNKKIKCRVVFEYSSKAVMMLKYDERFGQIVCDHLSPEKPSYQGQYMFYGPDFSYDGWKYTNGIWELKTDIDIRNMKK